MSRTAKPRVPNKARDGSLDIPVARQANARAVTCAADLTDTQVYMAAEFAARRSHQTLGQVLYNLYGFAPTADDVAHVEWVVSLHPEWEPWLDIARLGWDAWFEARYANPPPYPEAVEKYRRDRGDV